MVTLLSALYYTPHSAAIWAEQDISYMYNLIVENHPGAINSQDPTFNHSAHKAYQTACIQLSRARSDEEQKEILHTFCAMFHDIHVRVSFDNDSLNRYQKSAATPFSYALHESCVWVTLPTFSLSEQNKKEYEQILISLPTFSQQKRLIFDLRGNSGGNSLWASQLLQALFGTEYYTFYKTEYESNNIIDWRATTGNYHHISHLCTKFAQQFGKDSIELQLVTNIWNGMRIAIDNGDAFYTESIHRTISRTDKDKPANSVTASIIVIIDNHCASSCLTFIDELYAMKHPIILVGQTTQADSAYLDIRTVRLPSNKGNVAFPIKMYRNRPRKPYQPYRPDIYVDTTDDNALKNIVLLS